MGPAVFYRPYAAGASGSAESRGIPSSLKPTSVSARLKPGAFALRARWANFRIGVTWAEDFTLGADPFGIRLPRTVRSRVVEGPGLEDASLIEVVIETAHRPCWLVSARGRGVLVKDHPRELSAGSPLYE